jgi:hypothetical protein
VSHEFVHRGVTYAVNLTSSGGLSGRVTQTKVVGSSDCGTGKIDVEVIVQEGCAA